jgi:hypothetical protein
MKRDRLKVKYRGKPDGFRRLLDSLASPKRPERTPFASVAKACLAWIASRIFHRRG